MYRSKKGQFSMTCVASAVIGISCLPAAERVWADSFALEEITVTARKREEGLQDTPVAITAFTGEMIENRFIDDLSQIEAFTPNLTFDSSANISGSNSAASVFIRGVGQSDFQLTTDPGVGIFIDGAYVSRGVGGTMDLIDIERIEVLKGPQGTLFGKNTIGGAISITTRKPAEEFGGKVTLTAGEFNRYEARASIDLPITDQLLSKLSVSSVKSDGYVERIAPRNLSDSFGVYENNHHSGDLGDDDVLAGRLDLLWLVNEDLTARFILEGTRERENGSPLVAVGINPNSAFNGFWNGVIAPQLAPELGSAAFFNEQYLTHDPYKTFSTMDQASELDMYALNLTLDWTVNERLDVKSITSYRDVDSYFTRDFDYSPLAHSPSFNVFEFETFSQEFQFSGDLFQEKMHWMLGVFYFEEEGSDNNSPRFPVVFIRSGGSVDNDSFGVFISTTYDVTDRLSVTAGVRYSDENVRFTPDQVVLEDGRIGISAGYVPNFAKFDPTIAPPLPPFGPTLVGDRVLPFEEAEQDEEKVTPSVSVQYRWSDALLTYLSYSEGFKNGGFTQRVFPPRPDIPPYDPEEVEVYEIGFKMQAFDNRVRFNGAAFFTDYSDLQFTVNDGVAPTIRNVAKAEIKGVELELTALLTRYLEYSGGLGYIDAEYTNIDASALAFGLTDNHQLSNTPEWSATSSLSYTIDLQKYGELVLRGDWSYRSKVYNDAANSDSIAQGSFSLFNASVSFITLDGKWKVTFGGKNLGDEEYIVSGFDDLATNGVAEAVFGRPREWRASVTYNF